MGNRTPRRRSCKDHPLTTASPVVPRVGFEPTFPRLQRGAFTRLASWANIWSGRRVPIPLPRAWRARALPLSYVRIWWVWHGIEPAQHGGADLQSAGFPSPLHTRLFGYGRSAERCKEALIGRAEVLIPKPCGSILLRTGAGA